MSQRANTQEYIHGRWAEAQLHVTASFIKGKKYENQIIYSRKPF